MEFYLNPKDKDDNSIEAEGKVSIKLWEQIQQNFEYKCLKRTEDLLETWDDISVKKENYDFIGSKIRAEYKTYKITDDGFVMGCAEITFTTNDGKSFVALDDTIFING